MRPLKPHVTRNKSAGTPGSAWVVDGLRDQRGTRIRKFFPSRAAANQWLSDRSLEIQNQGRATFSLTDPQRVDAVRALAILAPYGATLTAAAEAFAARTKLLERTVTFGELRAELLVSKGADRMSPRYVNDLKTRLARFGQQFDARPVATIDTRELDDWLRALELSPVSRMNFRKVLRTAFEYAVGRGYAQDNPVTKTASVKVHSGPPGILTPGELAALLNAATFDILPSFAIAAFAGIRDAEIGRMTWDMIDLASGHIKIDARVAKTSSRRIIPMPDNLKAWLAPYAKGKGAVRGSQSVARVLAEDARAAALKTLKDVGADARNLAQWPHNALRHSYASYRMAIVANAAQVAEECGHSVQIMKEHYRELVTRAEAEAWFAVSPVKQEGNILSFAAVAGA